MRVLFLVPFLLAAKRAPPPPLPPQLQPSVAAATVVDLTHPLSSTVPYFPGGVPFAAETLATVEADGYYFNKFTTGEHTGTHVDAPNHFVAGAEGVDAILPRALIGPLVVIDISARVAEDPDTQLVLSDIAAWEAEHGIIPPGAIAMIRTGWDDHWPDTTKYQNKDEAGTMHFPGVGLDASQSLASRNVACIGIDTLSTDSGTSKLFHQHKHFLRTGRYHIENVTNLDKVPAAGAIGIVAPLPLVRGSGAPARVLALVPEMPGEPESE